MITVSASLVSAKVTLAEELAAPLESSMWSQGEPSPRKTSIVLGARKRERSKVLDIISDENFTKNLYRDHFNSAANI